jgi:hypothetical protein
LNPLLEFNNELNIWLNIPLHNYTQRLISYHQPRNNSKTGKITSNQIRIRIKDAINLYKEGILQDRDIQDASISSYSGKGKIPAVYDLDEDFARVLGAYAAEGSIHFRTRKKGSKEGGHIFVCGHDTQHLIELRKIIKKIFKKNFKITSSGIDKNGENHRIQGNSSTAYLFKFVFDCGHESIGKKVSPFILSSPKKIQQAFFDEYMIGDGYVDLRNRVNPLLEITSKSLGLIEGLMFISINISYGYPSLQYRRDKSSYHLRIVQYNKDCTNYNDISGLKPKMVEKTSPRDEYVYDISVEKNNNFVCANGLILAHNTDGIYLGCSQSIGNIPALSTALGVNIQQNNKKWLTKPQVAYEAIASCNTKWRETLKYPEFELEPEVHDAMLFVKHKNYLIFDAKNGSVDLITKGNNFKGSDKANIARRVLESIMMQVLRDNPEWEDEEEVRKQIRESIITVTQDVLSTLDLTKVDLDDLTLLQSVQPAKRYKKNMDGSMSTFGKRAEALEKLVGHPIRSRIKMKFVVTKQPLPGITNPSKSGVKPIDYMYPVDHIKNMNDIDLDWYKKMIENFIQGAFGLSGIVATEQTGLDAWM